MNNEKLVRLLEINAHNTFLASLSGGGSEKMHELFQELNNPQPGDLVIETSTFYMKNRGLSGIGRLTKIAMEDFYDRAQAKENGYDDDEEIPKEKAFYITLEFDDKREYRWTNASFIKVLEKNI